MKAIWNNTIIAESGDTIIVEGNYYFPADSVKMEYLKKSGNTYTCPIKMGTCDYYNVTADGKTATDGAWMYPKTNFIYNRVEGKFAFWNGVEIKE